MPVSSKEVNRALRAEVWPALKEHGFSRRTDRTAWRDRPERIDVVNFQSFNAYLAEGIGSTTFSFSVNLGIHPRADASQPIQEKDGLLRPQEWQCAFRRSLLRRGDQPELDRNDVWFVRPDGSNIEEIVAEATDALLADGLRWFEALRDRDRMLAYLRYDDGAGDTWGPGGLGSPRRLGLIAALE